MNRIKKAMSRKFGPLPAWAWSLIALGAVYYYRKFRGPTSVSGTGTGSVAQSNPTPGTGEQVLQPGESIYDPTAGTLETAPGGGAGAGAGDTTSADALTSAMNNLAGAIATGEPAPPQAGGPAAGNPPGPQHRRPPRLIGRGAIRAPFGHKAPRAPKGYRDRGLGGGFWEFVPKRKPKPKGQQNARKRTSKYQRPGHPATPRSATTHRSATGGRTRARSGGVSGGTTISRNAHAASPQRLRQPTRTPPVRAVVQQRRPATNPAPATRAPVAHAPKPSAPPPRTQRAPTKAPARPAARRRK